MKCMDNDNYNFESVWMSLEKRLREFISAKVNDKADVEDILQETFIRIHDNIDSLNDKTKVKSWVYQISRNLVNDYYRSQKKMRNTAADIFIENEENEEKSEDLMSETLEDMIKMMDRLPAKYCEALCLTELGNMNQLEYSKHSGLSYSAAKSRIQRARVMLRDMLMNCCHYHFDKYGTVIDVHPIRCCCCQHGQI